MPTSRWVDASFAGVLLVIGVLEAVVGSLESDRPAVAIGAAVAGAAAFLVRSRRPLTCLAVVVFLLVVIQIPDVGPGLTAAIVIGFLVALGTVGRRTPTRISIVAYAVTTGTAVVAAALSTYPWDTVIMFVGCSIAWGAGRLMRREAERNIRLTALAAELVTEGEARAREAVSAERARIARELHDAVAHTVSVMTIHVGGVRRRLEADSGPAVASDVLREVERLGREAVEELHRAVGILRLGSDPDAGPAYGPLPRLADVEQLAERVRAAGVPVEIRIEGAARPLPGGLELAAYRVIQEGLTNTLKHAGPARAEVRVAYCGSQMTIEVRDDGRGVKDPLDVGISGHGLAGMRERAALYGGQIQAGPSRTGGYALRVTLPLPQGTDQ
jgi:signal transduction histidine kinase